MAVYVRTRWCFIACGFYPSRNRPPPSAYFVVIVGDWWLWLSGCQPEWVGTDAQGGGSACPPLASCPLTQDSCSARQSLPAWLHPSPVCQRCWLAVRVVDKNIPTRAVIFLSVRVTAVNEQLWKFQFILGRLGDGCIVVPALKLLFKAAVDAIIRFLSQSQMRRLMPLPYLYTRYEAAASSLLA